MTETVQTEDAIAEDVTHVYELGYHMLPTVAAESVDAEVQKVRSAIEKRGGSFIAEGTPEMHTLAYPLYVNNGGKKTKYERAHFGWVKFEMHPSEAVALKEEDVDTNANILRSILFVTTREETRAQLQTAEAGVLREVATTGTIKKQEAPDSKEAVGEVSEEALEKSIDDLVGEES